MCEICQQTFCPSMCPNAPEPLKFSRCESCGEIIYEGDDYYSINGEHWCERCVNDARRTAEVEW